MMKTTTKPKTKKRKRNIIKVVNSDVMPISPHSDVINKKNSGTSLRCMMDTGGSDSDIGSYTCSSNHSSSRAMMITRTKTLGFDDYIDDNNKTKTKKDDGFITTMSPSNNNNSSSSNMSTHNNDCSDNASATVRRCGVLCNKKVQSMIVCRSRALLNMYHMDDGVKKSGKDNNEYYSAMIALGRHRQYYETRANNNKDDEENMIKTHGPRLLQLFDDDDSNEWEYCDKEKDEEAQSWDVSRGRNILDGVRRNLFAQFDACADNDDDERGETKEDVLLNKSVRQCEAQAVEGFRAKWGFDVVRDGPVVGAQSVWDWEEV